MTSKRAWAINPKPFKDKHELLLAPATQHQHISRSTYRTFGALLMPLSTCTHRRAQPPHHLPCHVNTTSRARLLQKPPSPASRPSRKPPRGPLHPAPQRLPPHHPRPPQRSHPAPTRTPCSLRSTTLDWQRACANSPRTVRLRPVALCSSRFSLTLYTSQVGIMHKNML